MRSGLSPSIDSPNSLISPSLGFRKPMIAEMQVVFPAPLRPSSASTPLGCNEKLTPCNMWLSP
jgi:hypothetical protein